MKYTFSNGPGKQPIEIELGAFQLSIQEDNKVRTMPYSSIIDVHLERKGSLFHVTLRSLDFGTVRISNRLYVEAQWKDQSRQYHTFVRVLHLHLNETQCEAEFSSGFKLNSVTVKIIALTLVASTVYFAEDYLDLFTIHPLMASGITLGIGGLLFLAPYFKNPPKTYRPSDIPLNMLPPAY